MNTLSDAATTPNIHTVIRTLAIALLALALIALVPGRALFRPWHVRVSWPGCGQSTRCAVTSHAVMTNKLFGLCNGLWASANRVFARGLKPTEAMLSCVLVLAAGAASAAARAGLRQRRRVA